MQIFTATFSTRPTLNANIWLKYDLFRVYVFELNGLFFFCKFILAIFSYMLGSICCKSLYFVCVRACELNAITGPAQIY